MTTPLIDLSGYTEHELFLKSVKGLASQGFERALMWMDSAGNLTACRYQAGEKRCAAGWLVDDETALEAIAGCGKWMGVVAAGLATEAHKDFINNLQSLHDRAKHPSMMKEKFIKLAAAKGWPIPEELR